MPERISLFQDAATTPRENDLGNSFKAIGIALLASLVGAGGLTVSVFAISHFTQ